MITQALVPSLCLLVNLNGVYAFRTMQCANRRGIGHSPDMGGTPMSRLPAGGGWHGRPARGFGQNALRVLRASLPDGMPALGERPESVPDVRRSGPKPMRAFQRSASAPNRSARATVSVRARPMPSHGWAICDGGRRSGVFVRLPAGLWLGLVPMYSPGNTMTMASSVSTAGRFLRAGENWFELGSYPLTRDSRTNTPWTLNISCRA